MKPLTLDAVMACEERWIRATFPNGARVHTKAGKPDRYSPAEGKPDRTLHWLLREKRKRQEPIRLLGKTHGYTTNPAHALQTSPDTGEAIDEFSQKAYSEEGWQGFLGGLEAIDSRHPRLYVQRRISKKAA